MKVTKFTSVILCALILSAKLVMDVGAADPVESKVKDALTYAPAGSVQFSGSIGQAIQTCKQGRILGQRVPDLLQPFAVRAEKRGWRSEFWGKWFTSAVLAYRYEADPQVQTQLDLATKGLIGTQTPDGAITTYQPDSEFNDWDTWGRKYSLLGLLADYDLTGDHAVLDAARRHADYVVAHFSPGKADIATNGNWTGMAAGSILEPMVLLYRRTGDARYLQFSESIVQAWEGPRGPDLVRKALAGVPVFKMFPGPDPTKHGYMSGGYSKAYEMMSCYEGLVELYRVTGEPKHLESAQKVFANIRDTEITVIGSGSSWERWCSGHMRQTEPLPEWMETCVTATWIKFATQLLRLTGDPHYVDEIERSVYNPLLGSQKADGVWWCHYNPLAGVHAPAPEQCGMHMNCCVANGPRALMLLPALALMSGEAGPVINLYEPGTATLPLPSGKPVKIEIKSDYPRPGPVEIVVRPESKEDFTLSLRIPTWSQSAKVTVNGKRVKAVQPGTYLRLTRQWRSGDKVQVQFDFTVQLVKDPGGSGCVTVTRGPVVFALDRRLTAFQTNSAPGMVLADASGVIKAVEVKQGLPDGVRMALDVPFEVAGKRTLVLFCDYASAGQTWGKDSEFRVWLPQPLNLADPFKPRL